MTPINSSKKSQSVLGLKVNELKPQKILLIENEPDYSKLIRLRLSKETDSRFSVECSETLSAGFEKIRSGPIDAILFDLNLPDSRGIDTLIALQDQASQIPIVILTGESDHATALEAIRLGAQDFLLKENVEGAMLVRILSYAIERHRVGKELNVLTRQLQEANSQLEKLAFLDPLTELLNRRGLEDALAREIRRARREASELLVLLIDLDDFKRINDTWGHAIGDIVLKETAQRLKNHLRATDYIARVGGDEFLILLPQVRISEGTQIAEKLRMSMAAATFSLPFKDSIQVTGSFGMILVSEGVASLDELLAKTHAVLYQSKRNGKNRVSYDRQGKLQDSNAPLLSQLYEQLRKKEVFQAFAQPIVRLSDGQIVSYELLTRSSIKDFEMPDEFFSLCLEADLLTYVDRQCFETCAAASGFFASEFHCHLNLFPSTMIEIPPERLLEKLPAHRDKSTYCIELSEQQIVGNPGRLSESIRVLKKSGILVAIDDVGFGRSCLESLILLEPDIVKIDKKLIHGISSAISLDPLKRLLKMADALNATAMAEGVESEEGLKVLQDLGVQYGQGYLFGKPTDANLPSYSK